MPKRLKRQKRLQLLWDGGIALTQPLFLLFMKPKVLLLLSFSLLTSIAAKAQCLSLKELLVFVEEGFDMPEKRLRDKGFAGVRWRHDDLDIAGNAGAY